MRFRHRLAPLAALLMGSCIVPARGHEVEGRFQFLAGQRRLEETDEFDAFEHTPVVGFELGFGAVESGPGVEMGVLFASDDDHILGSDVDGKFTEIYTGYRFDWQIDRWRPYAGFGFNVMGWELDADAPLDIDDKDDTIGIYGMVGFEYMFNDIFSMGLRGRYVTGEDLDLGGFDVSPDYAQVLFTVGLRY